MIRMTIIAIGALLFVAPMLGMFEQPWSPFWFGQHDGLTIPTTSDSATISPALPVFGPQPVVSDAQRFAFALLAGFSFDEALTATAISIAENGGGDPATLSGANRDGSHDLGLWQINSRWWPGCGGQAEISTPVPNALCAHDIYSRQGWCAWSVFDARCGPGHTGSYANYLPRAAQASR